MKRADPQRERADPQRVKEHSQLQSKNLIRKNGCAKQTAGSLFRKGRSRDKVAGCSEDPRSCTTSMTALEA